MAASAPVATTQVSLLRLPTCPEITSASSCSATRVRAPSMTAQPSGPEVTKARSSARRSTRPPPSRVGTGAVSTRAWPTQAWGSASMAAASVARSAADSRHPKRALGPRRRAMGLTTSSSRLASTWDRSAGVAAPPGRHRGDGQVLVQEPAAQPGQAGEEGGIVEHARPRGGSRPRRCPAGRPPAARAPPWVESLRSSSGSQSAAATRRTTTWTGSSPPRARRRTWPSRTTRSAPSTRGPSQGGGQEGVLEEPVAVGTGREDDHAGVVDAVGGRRPGTRPAGPGTRGRARRTRASA